MRKVTIVVLVLITSCQVSLKPKSGPLIAQATIVASASVKVIGRPLMRADAFAKRLNHDFFVHALKANGRRALFIHRLLRALFTVSNFARSAFETHRGLRRTKRRISRSVTGASPALSSKATISSEIPPNEFPGAPPAGKRSNLNAAKFVLRSQPMLVGFALGLALFFPKILCESRNLLE